MNRTLGCLKVFWIVDKGRSNLVVGGRFEKVEAQFVVELATGRSHSPSAKPPVKQLRSRINKAKVVWDSSILGHT